MPRTTLACLGDADALRRMLRNLVENALAYTPPGGEVTVSVTDVGHDCRLTVADTGVGIAADDLPRVFDRFYRADKARANTGGSGLGLSIVQSIAQAHGGRFGSKARRGGQRVHRDAARNIRKLSRRFNVGLTWAA